MTPDDLLAITETLVSVESPSSDPALLARAADVLDDVVATSLGARAERHVVGGLTHLRWSWGTPRVVLIGHYDTVWPAGTLARWPFSVAEGRATGPGSFDMKAGIAQGIGALAEVAATCPSGLDGVTLLLTADEEVGSQTSRALIEDTARGAQAALVLEPSAAGALKTSRKGTSMYRFVVRGRAAHAGLEPEKGINALVEMAHLVTWVGSVADPAIGTTVTPTVATSGTTTNTVPAEAILDIDGRALSIDEQWRVDAAMRARQPVLDGAELVLEGGPNRPPMEPSASAALFERAVLLAADLGFAVDGVGVGGGSDGNFTAPFCPTLDGLGAVGDHAHGEGEYVVVDQMVPRSRLVAALVADLLSSPVSHPEPVR